MDAKRECNKFNCNKQLGLTDTGHSNEELLNEVITGIKDYFNKALGSILLYRFERHQYASLHKQFRKQEMVDIYGAEHLLRLFGKYLCFQ